MQTLEGKTYLLRYDEETDEWTLQSGFDGDELLARSSIELVTIDRATEKKRPNSKLNHANTVTLPMPKFRSTGFWLK